MRYIAIPFHAAIGISVILATAPYARAQSATDVTYSGASSRYVQYLLSHVPDWKVPTCATCTDGVTPTVRINKNSQRDTYVAAAVTYAWGAEAYSRLGETEKAEESAGQVKTLLDQADALCSEAPAADGGGSGLQTLRIWPCPAPF